ALGTLDRGAAAGAVAGTGDLAVPSLRAAHGLAGTGVLVGALDDAGAAAAARADGGADVARWGGRQATGIGAGARAVAHLRGALVVGIDAGEDRRADPQGLARARRVARQTEAVAGVIAADAIGAGAARADLAGGAAPAAVDIALVAIDDAVVTARRDATAAADRGGGSSPGGRGRRVSAVPTAPRPGRRAASARGPLEPLEIEHA